MSGPVQIVPIHPQHDVIDALRILLAAAEDGQLTGVVFGCLFKGSRFYYDSVGSLHRNQMAGIACASALTHELNSRIRKASVDTVL